MPADVIEEFTGAGSSAGGGQGTGPQLPGHEFERGGGRVNPPSVPIPGVSPTVPGTLPQPSLPGQPSAMDPQMMGEIIRMIVGSLLQRFFAGGTGGMSQFGPMGMGSFDMGLGGGGGFQLPQQFPGFQLPQPGVSRPPIAF